MLATVRPSSLMLILVLMSVVYVLGCAHSIPPQSWSTKNHYTDYEEALNTWTRSKEVFENFEGRLFVNATLLSPSFEVERSNYRRERLMWTEDETKKKRRNMLKRVQNHLLFFISITTQDSTQNDLRPRGSPLTIHLVTHDGQVLNPQWITELTTQEQSSYAHEFFHLTQINRGYWVGFSIDQLKKVSLSNQKSKKVPPSETAESSQILSTLFDDLIQLRLSSLSATVTLSWKIKP